MPEQTRLSGGIYACLLMIYVHVAQVEYLPGAVAQIARQDTWLAFFVGGLFGLLVAFLALWAVLQHPGKSPVMIAREQLGRWLGGALILVYLGYFVWIYSLVVRNVVDFSVLVLLPGTPGRVVAAVMAAVALYAVWHGVEAIARVSFQVLAAIGLSVIILPLLVIREMGPLERAPILQYGLGPVLAGGALTFSWFGESVVVLTLGAHLSPKARAWRWTAIGVAGAAADLALLAGVATLVLGPHLPSRFLFPVYTLTQQISLAHIVERIELVLVAVWLSGMVVKMGMALYAASDGVGQLLGLKSHRWPAVVIAIAGAALTQIWDSALQLSWFIAKSWVQQFHMVVQIGIPLLLLAATFIRRALRPKGNQHAQA